MSHVHAGDSREYSSSVATNCEFIQLQITPRRHSRSTVLPPRNFPIYEDRLIPFCCPTFPPVFLPAVEASSSSLVLLWASKVQPVSRPERSNTTDAFQNTSSNPRETVLMLPWVPWCFSTKKSLLPLNFSKEKKPDLYKTVSAQSVVGLKWILAANTLCTWPPARPRIYHSSLLCTLSKKHAAHAKLDLNISHSPIKCGKPTRRPKYSFKGNNCKEKNEFEWSLCRFRVPSNSTCAIGSDVTTHKTIGFRWVSEGFSAHHPFSLCVTIQPHYTANIWLMK